MTGNMPGNTKEALALAMSTWPKWDVPLKKEPRLVNVLTGGLTNSNFLIDAGGRLLVLRVGAPESQLLGIDRAREQRVLAAIANFKLAPQVIYCQQQTGLLVSEYVAGRHWQMGDLSESGRVQKLIDLLQQLHRMEGDFPCFDYASHIEHYYQGLLGAGGLNESVEALYQRAKAGLGQLSFIYRDKPRVLCHHDPGPLNLIESGDGALVLLDWEYSGGGWAVMDQLALARQWKLPASVFQIPAIELIAASSIWGFIDRAWYSLNGTA